MTSGNAMGSGAKLAVAVIGIIGLAAIGNFLLRPEQPIEPEAAANQAAAPASEPAAVAAVPEVQPAAPAAPEIETKPLAVTIENWRVEADGSALVSGRTAPLALLSVLVDGAKVAEGAATQGGDFVMLFTLPANENPSLLTIDAVLPDGTALPAPAAVALAPIAGPKPVEVAAAEPAASEPAAEPPVEEPAAPTSVVVTEEGAKVVSAEPPAPVAPGEVAAVTIAAIAYTPEGAVQLSGMGQAAETIRIYLDNALAAETAVQADGSWQVVLTDTTPGIYTLRADQIDATGKVTARFETPFKRETPEALAALSTPKSGEGTSDPAPASEPVVVADAGQSATGAGEASTGQEAGQTGGAATETAETPSSGSVASEADPAAAPSAAETGADAGQAPAEATAAAETAETKAAPSQDPASVTAGADPAATEASPPEPAAPEAAQADGTAPAASTTAPAPTASAEQQPAPAAPQGSTEAPSASSTDQPAEPGTDAAPGEVVQMVSITVQPGYSLWKIARDTYGDGILYVQVYEANKTQIGDPDLIYPGQVFELPVQKP